MRILPVKQNIQAHFYIKNSCSDQQHRNTPSSYTVHNNVYNRAPVNFGARVADIRKSVDQIALEDKLAYALQKLKSGEFLLVAKDLMLQAAKLKECIISANFLITKICFLMDKSLNDTLLFTKLHDGNKMMFNPNEDPILLNGFQPVKHNDVVMIDENDMIILSNQAISIKDAPEGYFDMDKCARYFLSEFDFKQDARKATVEYNLKKLLQLSHPKAEQDPDAVTFAKIGGQKEVIDKIKKRILFPMKYPEVFRNNNMNHGAILYGPPGTGKSLIAEALANESGASVFKLCATDLTSKWVGESEKNWRNLFADAQAAQPSIIYIDEFDAIARQRGGIDVHGDKLINQLLSLMSNIEKSKDNVYLIAATNNYKAIDPAILRSGRFGLHLEVKVPDLEGTKEILKIHTQNKPMAKDFDIDEAAELMYAKGMTGADIAAAIDSAYSNAFERLDFYKAMDENRFTQSMMNYFDITKEDLIKAISDFERKKKIREPIGYKSNQ